jgi:hypothetical protein
MKEIFVAIIALIGGVLSAIIGASWFTPDLIRLDVLFPTKEVSVLDDFVFVHFEDYRERSNGNPVEIYQNPYTLTNEKIFDKSKYVEYVWLRKTKGNYAIQLTTAGAAPEIKAISPPLKEPQYEQTKSGARVMTADLALDQSPEFKYSGTTPNPKTLYVYRNGYQGRNSSGGKNIRYATDRLTFVYDFSSLNQWPKLFQVEPKACLKRASEDRSAPLEMKWANGVAIVEAFSLLKGDKVRVFWTWNRLMERKTPYQPVTCEDALR